MANYVANRGLTGIDDSEQVARLLFGPQMIHDGTLTPSAFPMDELLAQKGKNGSSVDRCNLLDDRDRLLCQKAHENANVAGGRAPYGFCFGKTEQIRGITIAGDLNPTQALEIFPDEITDNDPPKPWDRAHALIRKFDDTYTRAKLRGVRDKLCGIFSVHIVKFQGYRE